MKLQWLIDFRTNEVEAYALVGMLFGACVFLIACFWDNIAGVQIAHNQGYGWQQILVMVISGLYTFWGWYIQNRWGDK